VTFPDFEETARRAFEGIPTRFRQGVDGLVIRRKALAHPRFDDIYTLGECTTESYPSGWDGPDTIRSLVVLYWGSFAALAGSDASFDWDEQIWETLTHEIRHHLESLADEDDLGGVDYAMEQTFLRHKGYEFDPAYYRSGDRIGPGAYAVEDAVYIEQLWTPAGFARARSLGFSWAGRRFAADRPAELGDVHFVRIADGVVPPPFLELVLVRKSGWLQRVRRFLGGGEICIFESEARARERLPAREP